MRIFLSASYGRRLELCGYRDELIAMGHEVCARWLDGQANGTLHRDIEDMFEAECFIAFTEHFHAPGATENWRMEVVLGAELGFVLGVNRSIKQFAVREHMRLIVIGNRENVYHWVDYAEHATTWEDAKKLL